LCPYPTLWLRFIPADINTHGLSATLFSEWVYFCRIIEQIGSEGSFRGHLSSLSAMIRGILDQIRLLRVLTNLTLNVSRDGELTTSLGDCARVSPPTS